MLNNSFFIDKIKKLYVKNGCNASELSRGCGVSVQTVYKIFKESNSTIRTKTLQKVLDYLIDLDKEQSKMYQQNVVNEPNSINLLRGQQNKDELFNLVKEQSEKIKEVNQKIDILFDIIRAGSQQLSKSLIDNLEIKTKIDASDDNLNKQMDSLTKKIVSLSNRNKKTS